MNHQKSRGHVVDVLFTLALFCVFAASSLLVVLIGAGVYKNTATQMTQNFDTRTSLTYIGEKIRQNDTADAVYLDEFGDGPALVLAQEFNGQEYLTQIYLYNGQLYELFSRKNSGLAPNAGQLIMDAPALTMEQLPQGMLRFTVPGGEGRTQELLVSPRCSS